LDRESLASLLASAISSLGIAAGFVWQYLIAIPVGAIILTASLGYFFQRRMQSNIRKYEIQRLAIQEALSPIYGEVLKLQSSIDQNRAALARNFYSEWQLVWQNIRLSHRYYIIPEPLRSMIEAFFHSLSEFNKVYFTTAVALKSIEDEIWSKTLGISTTTMSSPLSMMKEDGMTTFYMQNVIFWGVNPIERPKSWNYTLTVYSVGKDGVSSQRDFKGDDEVARMVNDFCEKAFAQATHYSSIVEGRKKLGEVQTASAQLRFTLEEEFQKWSR